ncbi:calcitonin gene-related peptide 2 isoform X2 [Felis catus]|uniref:Calcitonin peptide-like domain-containing protein n=5 Tax=Felinae TaxID=338152 RepID=A0ABI7Y4D3_FELCA|nr:calcitonin gene-related peptide 2 isoform X2 [Felis catus]XP_044894936.1 calcitonin gene-related peptide 2 isoform X2 [Felis catus]
MHALVCGFSPISTELHHTLRHLFLLYKAIHCTVSFEIHSSPSGKRMERGIMGFGKSSPFLAFSILVLCQAGSLQAAPFRSALESLPDPTTLSEKEGRLLLAALVKAYVQGKTNELEQEQEQEETEGSSVTAQKRSCNTATCVTHRLAGLLSRSGGVVKNNFVPTNVGSEAFGRRRRDLHA